MATCTQTKHNSDGAPVGRHHDDQSQNSYGKVASSTFWGVADGGYAASRLRTGSLHFRLCALHPFSKLLTRSSRTLSPAVFSAGLRSDTSKLAQPTPLRPCLALRQPSTCTLKTRHPARKPCVTLRLTLSHYAFTFLTYSGPPYALASPYDHHQPYTQALPYSPPNLFSLRLHFLTPARLPTPPNTSSTCARSSHVRSIPRTLLYVTFAYLAWGPTAPSPR